MKKIKNYYCTNTVPMFKNKTIVREYENPKFQRDLIRTDNSSKSGVYAWINKVNQKFYIGSGDPLYLRLSDYYQNWYIRKRSGLPIVRALTKYGMENFSLVILEYTDPNNLILCEQKWINDLKPDYNINPIAGNSKGYKHTIESVEKMRQASLGRKHTEEVKQNMSNTRKSINNPFYGKTHTKKSLALMKAAALIRLKSPVKGIKVEITDLETKLTTVYDSIRKAALAINSDIKTILRREKSQIKKGINTPYKNKYIIVIIRNSINTNP